MSRDTKVTRTTPSRFPTLSLTHPRTAIPTLKKRSEILMLVANIAGHVRGAGYWFG